MQHCHMNTPDYILDEPLPLDQDFNALKLEGLAYIQACSGSEWTNLNPSDAGVTILDQICYALTELGYCNAFPVVDILTGQDGQLPMKDRFYTPEQILTSSPVTIADFRRCLVDQVEGVDNAIILPVNGVYQVYLLIDPSVSDGPTRDSICQAGWYCLNRHRNLGELFQVPVPLKVDSYTISGRITLQNAGDLETVLLQVRDQIRNYIFPPVVQVGYHPETENGAGINEIFNGPLLCNGWIPESALGKKKDRLRTMELTHLISAVEGVDAAAIGSFGPVDQDLTTVSSSQDQVLSIDLVASLQKGLEIYYKTAPVKVTAKAMAALGRFQHSGDPVLFGTDPGSLTALPKGRYRDVNQYYSIQNTFPEIFNVGADTVVTSGSDFRKAQSRQLKGYLTLFDQVLANQFSQLANIGTLFSFRNATSGAPSDREAFYATKDPYERRDLEYPVPFLAFSSTYFYQSLYNVPHIRPLLKDNACFNFSREIVPEKEQDRKSWIAYRQDPYNPYMRGLMEYMEDENTSLVRRNDILDHLLARHGESPLLIDQIIDGSCYSGDGLKDQVIFKSLYLQNLGMLSYYRQKAPSFMGAAKVSAEISEVPDHFEQEILGGDAKDFIFNTARIDHLEKLRAQDFIDYSTVELKFSMLFGLKVLYRDFIAASQEDAARKQESQLAFWMIRERKGVILQERALLQQYVGFRITLTGNTDSGPYWQISEPLNYPQALAIARFFSGKGPIDIDEEDNPGFTMGNTRYALDKVPPAPVPPAAATPSAPPVPTAPAAVASAPPAPALPSLHFFSPITGTTWSFTVQTNAGFEIQRFAEFPDFEEDIALIFPAFLGVFNTPAFTTRLDLFLQSTLPVHLSYKCYFFGSEQLSVFVPVFADWHNHMIYSDRNHE